MTHPHSLSRLLLRLLHRVFATVSTLILTASAALAYSQGDRTVDAADCVTVVGLDTLQVVSRRLPLATSQSLHGAELQSLSSTSIADALKYFAGVQIKDYGGLGGLKTVNVRSLGAQHVGVFIDGIRITNAQNGTVDLG